MVLPRLLVVFVFALILLTGRRFFFGNKYILIGFIIIGGLGVMFSDSVYQIVSRRVMQYAQSPNAMSLPFISEKWKNADLNDPNDHTRQRMIMDLTGHRRLLGKNRNDIINMLGKPDSTESFPGWDMKYYLGASQSSNGFGDEWLVIKFDENGIVKQYDVARN